MTGPQAVIPVALLDERLAEIESRLATLEREAGPLVIERNALKTLKARAVVSQPIPRAEPVVTARATTAASDREGPTLTKILLDFIVANPGLPSTMIAAAIVDAGFNGGRDPRKNVLTTIGNMITRGKLYKEAETGRIYPTGEPRQLNLVANG